MSATFLQAAQGTAAPNTVVNTTVSSIAVGSLIIVTGKYVGSGVTTTPSDDGGNTYSPLIAEQVVGTIAMRAFYALATHAVTNTVTITYGSSVTVKAGVCVFSGISASQPFDRAAAATNTSQTSASLSLSPSANGKLIVALLGPQAAAGTFTAGSNYAAATNNSTSLAAEYRLVGTTSETAPISWQNSSNWIEIAASFNLLPAGGTLAMMGV
jgi:hypothetical protein